MSVLVLPALAQAAPKAAPDPVKWQPTFASALAEAKRTNKPIFADFYTRWCGPCEYMDKVTFRTPGFVNESKKWVLVKIDAEENTTNVHLAEKFKVVTYPVLMFLKPNGKEAVRMTKVPTTPALVAKMKAFSSKKK